MSRPELTLSVPQDSGAEDPQALVLPGAYFTALRSEAHRRGLRVGQLVCALLIAIIRDKLFDAVLDEDET